MIFNLYLMNLSQWNYLLHPTELFYCTLYSMTFNLTELYFDGF